jgi:hypothetical protein
MRNPHTMQHRYMLHRYICYMFTNAYMPSRLLTLMLPDRHCHATLPIATCYIVITRHMPLLHAMLHAIRRHATLPHATSPCHTPHAAHYYCHMPHFAADMPHAKTSLLPLLPLLPHRYMPHVLHATCYIFRYIITCHTCYMLHATCYMLHATCYMLYSIKSISWYTTLR